MVFASGSIGQLFTKHKIGASIGAGIVFYMLGQIAASILMVLTGYFGFMNNINVAVYDVSENAAFSSMLHSGLLFSIIECVIFYIVCMVIIKKHLNLE